MTLDDTLLNNLTGWRPAGDGPHSFASSTSSGWGVTATAEAADTVGCRLTELGVSRPGDPQAGAPAPPATAADLTRWAVRTAERVTGLLEPLAVIEVDATRSEAVLRSETPARRGDDVQYYELRLRGRHAAALHRYQAPRTGPGKRRAVPFALTHEAIAKVVADVTAEG
ncbi:MAG TPA: hypothetical protein VGF55_20335 [Gemmataceae bacterium]|jgi:hypothetical protein